MAGAGLESTSHQYGLFHNICVEFELVTADASVIIANKTVNSDTNDNDDDDSLIVLIMMIIVMIMMIIVMIMMMFQVNSDVFHAVPMSYGTLGFLTAVTLRIVPYRPFVRLEYTPAKTLDKVTEMVTDLSLIHI